QGMSAQIVRVLKICGRPTNSQERCPQLELSVIRFVRSFRNLSMYRASTRWISALLLTSLLAPARPLTAEDGEATKPKKSRPAVVAVFTFNGAVTEKPTADDLPFASMQGESLLQFIGRVDKATEDDDVKAAVLLLKSPSIGTAQLDEIRAALKRFRDADKPIYAHAESLTTGSLALLAGASRISIVPTGDLFINGLYGEQLFLRGLFDKLGVTPDFLTCGSYKSAAEQYMRTGPSPESQEMTKWLYDGIFDSIVKLIADGRGVAEQKAKDWINVGLYSAERAKEQGIIDAVESRSEFEAYIKQQHGDDLKFDKKYGKKAATTVDLNNPFAALQLWAQILSPPQSRRSTKDAVAVVYIEGPIMVGDPEASILGAVEGAFSTPLRKALDEVADDDAIKAVVLRVNSPGGSAVASDIILNATKRVAAKKPFVVSMGDVAGSGGYYVACGTNTIFADEATITGSIGVVAGKLVTTDMWKRWGINFSPVKRGENAGILAGYETFSADEKVQFQAWMDEIYGVFKGHVTAARGDRLKKPLDDIAGGRVFTGKQALELGLVDRIGGLDDAIDHAAKEANLDDGKYEIRVVPRPKNFLEEIFADLAPQSKDSDKKLSLHLLGAVGPALEAADPKRVSLIKQALQQLDILHAEGVMLTMPVLDLRP
ncbi:MAG: signal peptide peptidase SppA, partial [Planctomycetaceae bacterium]|nr:signal peptide peptidase SppA [Planctomycetaceae bacterium]